MHKVLGIGGIFFQSSNPVELSAWYEKNLGVTSPPESYDDADWKQEAGPTVFGPMEAGSEHLKKSANLYINFRVQNLDSFCDQLINNGIKVTIDPIVYPNGRFASLADPEGNQIQLWEVKE